MNVRKIIQKRLRGADGGRRLDSDVNAAVAVNVGERGAVTRVSSTQRAEWTTDSRRDEQNQER